ncbi:hypothetical protein [Nonomuraea sp. SBT364]|uniref:hypothetical protein n=1 Tax=Nonomuraea sp. SBT364 TaxID=1580530 RepID=UPI00066CBAB8|nr:hypothetical protein [Nonomuraea sp. SBT364]
MIQAIYHELRHGHDQAAAQTVTLAAQPRASERVIVMFGRSRLQPPQVTCENRLGVRIRSAAPRPPDPYLILAEARTVARRHGRRSVSSCAEGAGARAACEAADQALAEEIHTVHAGSDGAHGPLLRGSSRLHHQ